MPTEFGPLLGFVSTASVAVVAGVLSYVAGRGMKTHEWNLNIRREKIAVRQRLYAEFLAEANRQFLQSIKEKTSDVSSFFEITSKFSEIELLASDEVTSLAKQICDHVIGVHAVNEKAGPNFYELKQAFTQSAKKEIAKYEK